MGCSPYEKLESFSLDSIGKVTQLVHKKSGARIVLVKNKDQARGFMVNFRTPPYDDTGLFHIFEHAVLAGSRLYPSKSNFSNVSDSSVASYINAHTSPFFTEYPFITKNSKDFHNLLSVYMDAVFFPKAVSDPRIMKREGWRYEIDPRTKKLSFNGIVVNEMKGVYASAYRNYFLRANQLFLPDTPYAYASGGDPGKIMNLRFEQFVSAHKKYYHPQNSLIVIYGDLKFKKVLSKMDRDFLSYFEKEPDFKAPEIPLQKDITYPALTRASYPGVKGANRDYLLKGYVLGPLSPVEKEAYNIMLKTFLNKVGSLRLKIMKKNLASSVSQLGYSGEDNLSTFVFEGTEGSKRERISALLQEEIDRVIQKGLDSEILNSVLSKHVFVTQNANNQPEKFSHIYSHIRGQWLFQGHSLKEELDHASMLKKVQAFFKDQNSVKSFFKKHFKENNRTAWLIMEPDPNYSERFSQAEKKSLEKALKLKPLSEYKKEDEIYQKWVSSKEPPEITDKTPVLELSDFNKEEQPIPFRKYKKDSYEIMEYPQSLNGISYVQLFFDLRGISEENLKNLTLLENILKKVNTKNHSFEELSQKIDTYTGGINLDVTYIQSRKNPKLFKPFMKLTLSFLNENREKSFSLLKEVLIHSDFSSLNRVQHLLSELKTKHKKIGDMALYFAWNSSRKPFFPEMEGYIDETSRGLFVNYLLKSKIEPAQLSSSLKLMLGNIFNQKRLRLVTVTSDKKELKSLRVSAEELVQSLPAQGSGDHKWSFASQKNHSAYAVPSAVQYAVETVSFADQGLEYSGALKVYSHYLKSRFLYPRLRQKMGAYGVFSTVEKNGLWSFLSFRDPNLKKTFDVFSEAVDFMEKEQPGLTQEKLKPIIVGSLKDFYKDRSVYNKVNQMTALYLSDSNWKEYMQSKKEILNTSPEDFKKISQALSKAFKHSQKAVSGNVEKIRESGLFDSILSLP